MAKRLGANGRLVVCGLLFSLAAPSTTSAQFEGIRRIFGGARAKAVKEMPAAVGPAIAGHTTSVSRTPGGLVLAEDREKTRGLAMVASQLELKRYSDVARRVGELLEDPATADFFMNAEGGGSRRSFKAELRQLIGKLPEEGRRAYELTFGPKAQLQLEEAAKLGQLEALRDVARRYPHTQAGYEAVYLVAVSLVDQGHGGEALMWFSQLRESPAASARYEPMLSLLTATAALKANEQNVAKETLLALKKTNPRAVFDIGGQSRPLFASNDQALAWLSDITGLLVKAAAQETVAQSLPLMKSVGSEFTVTPPTEEAVQERDRIRARQETPLPTIHPLVVGHVVLSRTGSGLTAVNLKTGQEAWRYPSERESGPSVPTEQMIWRDVAYGRIASDGKAAYMVEYAYAVPGDQNQNYGQRTMWKGGGMMFPGGGFGGGFAMPAMGGIAIGDDESGGETEEVRSIGGNMLSAVEIGSQGKLLWRVGGQWMVHRHLAGAFFLGPPTPFNDRLYVMAELQNAIHLVVLEKETGRLAWMQKLGDIEHDIYSDPYRRMAGASPVVVSGMVICPTACAGIVAVDIARRQLLWAYQYTRRQESLTQPNSGRIAQLGQGNRWTDNALWVDEGRLVATPLESDEMHCLDLKTGKPLWTRPRGASLYVASLHGGMVVTVEPRYLNARKLSDGNTAWTSSLQLPAKSRPSGRGVRSGDFYYLPLTDADGGYDKAGQIARIDLKAGKLLDVAASQRQFVPGNLTYHEGKFVSLGAQYLEVFEQAAVAQSQARQRLAANDRDADAWALLADHERSTGKLPQAIEYLRKAYDLSRNDNIRNAYAAALLDGIAANLPNHSELTQQLGRLAK